MPAGDARRLKKAQTTKDTKEHEGFSISHPPLWHFVSFVVKRLPAPAARAGGRIALLVLVTPLKTVLKTGWGRMELEAQAEQVFEQAELSPLELFQQQWRQQPGFIPFVKQRNVIDQNAELLPYAGVFSLRGWASPRAFA